MKIGKSIELALAKKELKKGDLAKMMGVNQTHVSKWIKSNTMTIKNLIKLCEILNMKVSEFIALGED